MKTKILICAFALVVSAGFVGKGILSDVLVKTPEEYSDSFEAALGIEIDCESEYEAVLSKAEALAGANEDLVQGFNAASDINVTSYDGLVDTDGDWSAALIQAEKDAASQGKDLFFPAGEYKLTGYMIKVSGVSWHGEGQESVLFVGDDFHSDTSIEGDNNYVIRTHSDASAPASFELYDMCFEHRVTSAAGFSMSGLFLVEYTDGVSLHNAYVKFAEGAEAQKTRVFDFKSGNCNTTFRNNTITGSNGGIGFRNFAKNSCTNMVAEYNRIIRSSGSVDEGIWVCANVGPIKGVTIRGNVISTKSSDGMLASGIYVVQADSYTKLNDNHVSNVLIEDNVIRSDSIMYYGINVGTYIDGFPDVEGVVIRNNTIYGRGSKDYTSSGIRVAHTNGSTVQGNRVFGAFNSFVEGGEQVRENELFEWDNSDGIETCGLSYCYNSVDNTVSVSQIGVKNVDILTNNQIEAPTNYLHTAKDYIMTDNTFYMKGNRGNVLIGAYITGYVDGFSIPRIHISGNVFYLNGKQLLGGDSCELDSEGDNLIILPDGETSCY
ncbi:MAG: hypothetical protein K6G30_15680 [Acetatifactor sp.]|nr:hypothetical protein [Acetatifactor sp.]